MIELLTGEPEFVPDVYFSERYGLVDAAVLGGTWMTIAEPDGSWQMPLLLTELGDGLREATSPYGYSGIYVTPEIGDAAVAERSQRWIAARELLRELRIVSVFLRFSPMDPGSAAASVPLEGLDVRRSGTTYIVEIGEPDDMWNRMEGRARTAIRKARRNGLTGSVRPFAGDDAEPGSDFRMLYEDTMKRVEADPRYWFEDSYYRGLVATRGPAPQIVEVADGDVVVAASLVLQHGDRAHYHLSGSSPEASRIGANALLVWSMLEWCKASDLRICHLGGGRDESDGLAKFKRSFGGQASDFHVGTSVVDLNAYTRLTRTRADEVKTTPEVLEATKFFPAFRAVTAGHDKKPRILISGIGKRNHVLRLLAAECASRGVEMIGSDASSLAPARVGIAAFERLPLATDPEFSSSYQQMVIKHNVVACLTLIDPEITVLSEMASSGALGDAAFLHPLSETSRVCEDKFAFFEAMDAAGIRTIPTFLSRPPTFPHIRKDRRGSRSSGFRVFGTPDEMAYEAVDASAAYIYQPYYGGQHYCVDAYYSIYSGKLVNLCAKEVLAKQEGESYLLRSVAGAPFADLLRRIGAALPLRGIVNVDVYADGDDLAVMEINCRVGGNYPAAHAVGANLFRHAMGEVLDGKEASEDFSDYEVGKYVSKFIGFSEPYGKL